MKIRDTLEFTISKLGELFEKQYGELPCGGWINPEIIYSTTDEILIRCYYNNYNNDFLFIVNIF